MPPAVRVADVHVLDEAQDVAASRGSAAPSARIAVVVHAALHDHVHLDRARPAAAAASIPSSTRATGKSTSFIARKVASSSESRLTVTRSSPAARERRRLLRRAASRSWSASGRAPSIAAQQSTRRSRSRRRSGSPPVRRIFSRRGGERARQPRDLLEREQLAALEERVVAPEDLPRHAVDAAEVAAVGDRDPQIVQRPAEVSKRVTSASLATAAIAPAKRSAAPSPHQR